MIYLPLPKLIMKIQILQGEGTNIGKESKYFQREAIRLPQGRQLDCFLWKLLLSISLRGCKSLNYNKIRSYLIKEDNQETSHVFISLYNVPLYR